MIWLRRLGWLAGLGAGLWFTAAVPVGRPRAPGLLEPAELWRWIAIADPASGVMAVVRLASGLALAYLLVVSSLLLFAEAVPALGRIAGAAVPHFARRLVGPVMGLTAVVVTPDLAQVEPATETAPPETATMVLLDDPGDRGSDSPLPSLDDTLPGTDPEPAQIVATMTWIGRAGSTGPVIEEVPVRTHGQASTWVVEPGDHFWSIAERTLDRMPADTGLHEHWLHLIELNRDRLPDSQNPDLILPGMHLRLP